MEKVKYFSDALYVTCHWFTEDGHKNKVTGKVTCWTLDRCGLGTVHATGMTGHEAIIWITRVERGTFHGITKGWTQDKHLEYLSSGNCYCLLDCLGLDTILRKRV